MLSLTSEERSYKLGPTAFGLALQNAIFNTEPNTHFQIYLVLMN